MREVFLVESDNKQKVEDILKRDDIVSRGSILIKSPGALGIKEDGIFFILDAPEETLKRAEELIKGLAKKYKDAKKVIEKVEEEENSAIEGFGNILG